MHEAERQLRRNLFRLAETHRVKVLETILRFFERVERQRGIVTRSFKLVVIFGVFFLQVPGIRQNDAAKINRGGCRVDGPAKSLLHKARDPAAMVKMSVRKNQAFNILSGKRQPLPVSLAPFFLSLKEPAINEHLRTGFSG